MFDATANMMDGRRMVTRTSKPNAPPTVTAGDVPVTRNMLGSVRIEVLKHIDRAREEAKSDSQRLDAKIGTVKAELDAKIDSVRAELKGDVQRLDAKIDAVKAELKGDIQRLDAEMREMKVEMREMKAEIGMLKAEMPEVKAAMHGMQAQMARIVLLVEEQNNRNKIVLDGIAALLDRQNQVEQRVTVLDDTVRQLASVRLTAQPA